MGIHRRQYLARAGAGLGVVSLAGCLETMSGSESGAEDVEVGDRTGERALDRSAGQLNEAALAMAGDDLEGTDPESVEFDPSEPREHLEQAREHLETAESELDDRDAAIEELRAYADVLETLIDVTAVVADETVTEDVEEIGAALEEGEDLEDAQETIADRTGTLESAQAEFDGATSDLLALDEERLRELAIVDLEEIESGATELGTVLDAQATLATGYETLLEGYADLETGREHADDRNHEDAEAAFTDAESHFVAASDTFESGKADAPADLVSYFETALCRSLHLEEAAAEFAEASAAAADRDVSGARQHQESAEDALEAARSC